MSSVPMPTSTRKHIQSARRMQGIFELRRPQRLLLATTVGRLLLVPILIAAFMKQPIITMAALALFIVTDIYDGVLARTYRADDTSRRALDSMVDRVAIDSCLVSACLVGVLPLPLLCGFVVRDIYLAVLCGHMMRERKVAIKADWLYRSLNLSVAAWAVAAPFVSANTRVLLAFFLLVFSMLVAADLTLLVKRVLAGPRTLRDSVLNATDLRQGLFADVSRSPAGATAPHAQA